MYENLLRMLNETRGIGCTTAAVNLYHTAKTDKPLLLVTPTEWQARKHREAGINATHVGTIKNNVSARFRDNQVILDQSAMLVIMRDLLEDNERLSSELSAAHKLLNVKEAAITAAANILLDAETK